MNKLVAFAGLAEAATGVALIALPSVAIPTIKLQPDLQVVWNPAYNPNAGPALVGQLQRVMAW